MRLLLRASIVYAALLVCGISAIPAGARSSSCGRACLNRFADQYVEAVIAHDPSRLPVTGLVKFTENGQKLALGDGFWRTATAVGNYKLYVDDPDAGQVGYFGTMREAGQPVIFVLRLKIEDEKISQIETIVVRGTMAQRGVASLEKNGADPIYLADVPEAQRASRLDLIDTANKYFSGMQLNDGKGDYSFFADDCNRLEDGLQTTNAPPPNASARSQNGAGTVNGTNSANGPPRRMSYSSAWSCKDQFQSGLLHFVTRIRDRRFVIVDRERGLVLAFVFFDHAAGDTRTFKLPNGRTVTSGPKTPWTWEIAVLFKIQGQQIHRIEGMLTQAPYGMGSGWNSWDAAMSDEPQW
jgi:hypothetical protein